jgi:hypothetical protein
MKTCQRCFREFREREDCYDNPAQKLGALFLKSTRGIDEDDLCPKCKKELGITSLLGFDE